MTLKMMPERTKVTHFESLVLGECYDKIIHASGLTVYVFPKKMTGKYALLATHFGSMDRRFRLPEKDGREMDIPDGVAHFLEHKMFENEDGVDSFARFSAYGADANAYTSYDRTVYLFGCTDRFGESLAELLHFATHPYFTHASVEKEKKIIAQEIKMYDDDPYERSFSELLSCLFEKNPVRVNICGTAGSLRRITPELLYRCHDIFYHPERMILTVCGDVTADEVMDIVDRELTAGRSRQVESVFPEEPEKISRSRSLVHMPVAKPIFCIGFKDEGYRLPDEERQRREAAMSILNEMLFSRAGELYNSLFERGMISPGLSYGYSLSRSFSFESLSGEAAQPEAVLTEILSYIDRIKREGLDAQVFERCRRVMCAEEIKNFDSVADIAGDLLNFAFEGGEIFHYGEILSHVSLEQVRALLFEVFDPAKVAMSVVAPTAPVAEG